jgi:putative serine protease PepD
VVDRSSLASIAAAIQPTVVSVATESGEGSGVVVSEDGYIVTNNHVVAGARDVRVTFNSGKQLDVDVVGTDPKTDLAVLKADATGLKFAAWGDSDAVQVGDTVLAIGSPLGLQGSVTAGIVSALHRTISVGDDNGSPFGRSNTPPTRIGDAIQTDAPINPGNSGGALVNMNGELVGINSAIATAGSNGNIGVGFAISANRAKAVVDQLIKGQPVSHPYLGVSIQNAENGGALIGQVEPGSPADQAGLEVGDVVTKVGDRGIASGDDLVGAIQSSTVGQPLTMTVIRNGIEQTLTATVGEQP